MAMPVWPLTLPNRPLADTWSRQAQGGRWTFKTDGGPAMVRPLGEKGEVLSMDFRMSAEQVRTFSVFFRESLKNGSLAFQFQDPDTGIPLDVRFHVDADSPYSIRAMGQERRVSMLWEVLP